MKFIDDLKALCKKHNVTLDGQLLILPDNYPQEISHTKEAYWGKFRVRGMSALEFKPVIPERKPAEIISSKRVHVVSDINGYTCPVTNKWVEGRAAHRENLKRTGCRVFEPGERENYIKEKPKEMERNAERAAEFLSDRIAERADVPA
jgi:hypothetical protein